MKVTSCNGAPQGFKPVSVTITLENPIEFTSFYQLANHGGSVSQYMADREQTVSRETLDTLLEKTWETLQDYK